MRWRVFVEPWVRPFFHLYAQLGRGMRIDVIGLVRSLEGEVLLVRSDGEADYDLIRAPIARPIEPEAILRHALKTRAGIELQTRPRLLRMQLADDPGSDHQLVYLIIDAKKPPENAGAGDQTWRRPEALPQNILPQARALIEATLEDPGRPLTGGAAQRRSDDQERV